MKKDTIRGIYVVHIYIHMYEYVKIIQLNYCERTFLRPVLFYIFIYICKCMFTYSNLEYLKNDTFFFVSVVVRNLFADSFRVLQKYFVNE